MFLPNPGILAAGVGGKSYDDWLAHIATRTPYLADWSLRSDFWPGYATGIRIGPATTDNYGAMYGSPWSSRGFSQTSPPGAAISHRVVRHSVASASVFDAIVSAGGVVLLMPVERYDGANYLSVNRNGYQSQSGSNSSGISMHITECSYWNPITGKPETMNPDQNIGPVPYEHTGW